MRSHGSDKRVIFITDTSDERMINEAKFKLAELHAGHGQLDRSHYWSIDPDQSDEGYRLLKELFKDVRRL